MCQGRAGNQERRRQLKRNGGNMKKEILDAQNPHWEGIYAKNSEIFGETASAPAVYAADFLKAHGKTSILELGAGQGRDTRFFANKGFTVYALDYANISVAEIQKKASVHGLSGNISAIRHDAREPLPFADNSLDSCYAHMLFCMALTSAELVFLSGEIRRVLKPEGICIYTVRHINDPHFGAGIHRGEDMYETNGFIVHFFSREKVNELSAGFKILDIAEFEEGALPRKLFRVTLEKMAAAQFEISC
jgi:SAM-dependent methyltransferase